MNNTSLNFLTTLFLAILFSFFMPWWSVMLAALLAGLFFSVKGISVFLVPFSAIFFYWIVYAFILSNGNDFILAKKIAVLLPLGGNAYALILVTAIVGGIAGGVAGVLGKQSKLLFEK
ncbi:hypothetical protein QWY87_11480 [Lutimonas halocynthiae]|uniref:hypothetical protein n=1 Tax=Lutimonas halocynthiae TaxID=1446477 RepID=UPI0025B3C434|nr:hypothetical protein [Lutimonas halocynthiae]MDN3643327.1 hypothetical protein [Lutimonas halocynthiae]